MGVPVSVVYESEAFGRLIDAVDATPWGLVTFYSQGQPLVTFKVTSPINPGDTITVPAFTLTVV